MRLCIIDIVEDTIVDGPGLRTTVYGAGCPHHCKGCHNPQSWDKAYGHEVEINDVMKVITDNPIANVTFSGGEPFAQAEAFTALAERIKTETDKTIWCYTGYRYEQLILDPSYTKLLSYVDVLVDGRFIEALKDPDLRFRGSSNQRIIRLKDEVSAVKELIRNQKEYNPI